MSIVTRYGDAVKAPTAISPAAAVNAEAQVRSSYSKIPVDNDSGTSLHILARLPSNARLLPGSNLYYTALTGLTIYDLGFGRDGASIAGKTATLVAAETLIAAGTVSALKALTAGNIGKMLWEQAGFTADPGGMIDIIGRVGAPCTTVGSLEALLLWAKG